MVDSNNPGTARLGDSSSAKRVILPSVTSVPSSYEDFFTLSSTSNSTSSFFFRFLSRFIISEVIEPRWIFRHELNNVNEFRKAIQLIALQSISFASTTSLLSLTLIRRRRDRSRREKSGGRGNGEEIPPLPSRREIERNVTGNYTCPGEEGLSWILT